MTVGAGVPRQPTAVQRGTQSTRPPPPPTQQGCYGHGRPTQPRFESQTRSEATAVPPRSTQKEHREQGWTLVRLQELLRESAAGSRGPTRKELQEGMMSPV